MHGDFSQRQRLIDPNLSGVLYQQGRVFIDTDGNAGTAIATNWQDTAATDAFGADVAAIPADDPLSFHVDSFTPVAGSPGEVDLQLQPGRCWADGVLVYLPGSAAVTRRARYLRPPVQASPAPPVTPAGQRDAVILDVWRESLSAFQRPADLIEPALGGPDTTERVLTSSALRLLRLAAGDTCTNLANKIDDHFNSKGRLTVTLQPTVAVGLDCPVVDQGGYTGFEHAHFRIEMAEVPGPVQFKWSPFNGGLVGRGMIDPLRPAFVQITANLQPIITAGRTSFYMEVREFRPNDGHWRTTYGGTVTLNNANEFQLPAAATMGAAPAAGTDFFFRLWHELRPITQFPPGAASPLVDGIRLEFEPDAAGRYTAEDYWTFTVRADGVPNDLIAGPAVPTLVNNERPHGVHHHRVCLAIVTQVAGAIGPAIDDCRNVFQPLTKLKGCCTFRVGDGLSSFGDFNTIQQAVQALPPNGGEICLLPGVFRENVSILDRRNIRIHGCGARSRVVGPAGAGGAAAGPVFLVQDSRGITFESFAIETAADGPGIELVGLNTDPVDGGGTIPRLREIVMKFLRITAGERCAVEGSGLRFLLLRECDIRMADVRGFSPCVFLTGDDMEIEHNRIRVRSGRQQDQEPTLPFPTSSGLGGLQIGGTSERVRIIDNWIQSGRGNGITLGSVVIEQAGGRKVHWHGWVIDYNDPCNPCRDGTSVVPDPLPGDKTQIRSAGALYDIRIERNRILDMGMMGIGVIAFFSEVQNDVISVIRLDILGNEIRRCLRRGLQVPDNSMLDRMGYGAIQLADTADCVIRENTIVDNGRSHIPAVCGIYVLHAEGLDVSNNTIVNNGAKGEEPTERGEPGARAGIFVAFAVAPSVVTLVDVVRQRVPVQSGVPAVKVHDNVVSQPVGQALYIVALGPISVQSNQLTSRGNLLRTKPLSTTFVAATVLIFNLGLSSENYFQDKGLSSTSASLAVPELSHLDGADLPPLGGKVDSDRLTGRKVECELAAGNVMFVNNQVSLDLLTAGTSLALSSIAIFTLDDLAFEDNQCDCHMLVDWVITNAALLGLSTRASGNRFKEGRYNAFFSALTYGRPLNCTSQNQATHCILAKSSDPPFLVFTDNRMLFGPLGIVANRADEGCQKYQPKKG